MAPPELWRKGDQITLSSVWDGTTRAIWPVTVIEDSSGLLATYLAPGTRFKRAATSQGLTSRLPTRDSSLTDEIWRRSTVVLAFPGLPFRLLAFYDEHHQEITTWYGNLERPHVRTHEGYDFTDLFLDVVFDQSFSRWHWKDEDELKEAVDARLLDPEEALRAYEAGKQAVEFTKARGPELLRNWWRWKPDTEWRVPILR